VPHFQHVVTMKELGQEQAPRRAFQNIWEKHRALFIAGIGNAGAPSRKRAADALGFCKSILDVGCGPGVFLTTLQLDKGRRPLERYVGIEAVHEMLLGFPQPWPEYATFQHGTAEEIPFKDNEFEGVLVRHLLEHLKDPLPALGEACRVCSRTLVIVFSQWPHTGSKSVPTDDYLGAARWSHAEWTMDSRIRRAGFRRIDREMFNPNRRDRLAPREAVWVCQRNEETRSAI